MNRHHTDFLTVGNQVVDSLTSCFGSGTHQDDDAFSIFSTVVVEQVITTAGNLVDFVHVAFNYFRNALVEGVAGFSVLEEVVGVLSHTACYRLVRSQLAVAELSQRLLVNQRSEVFVVQSFNLLDFVRSTETVEEIQERNTGLDRSQVSYTCKVHHFLYGAFAQHGKSGLTARHHVLVVTEDTECVRSQRTG